MHIRVIVPCALLATNLSKQWVILGHYTVALFYYSLNFNFCICLIKLLL